MAGIFGSMPKEVSGRRPISFKPSSENSSSRLMLLLWGLAFIASRIPFIFSRSGYGLDPDAYYVLLSAQKILTTGSYSMSRPPGFPLFEILCALLFRGGPMVTNGMTALVSCLSLIPLAGILRLTNARSRGWLFFAFCFAPILWIQSNCTMDYMWALFWIILAYYLFLNRKYSWGAICLGIAVGFRISSGLMIIPFGLQIALEERSIKKIIVPLILFGLVSLMVYSPVFLNYGLSFLRYVPYEVPVYIWGYRTMSELFGPTAFLVLTLGITAFLIAKNRERLDRNAKIWLLIISIYILLYIKLPAETAYLIPIIPFGLILLDKILSPKLFVLFCILFVLNGVVSLAAIDKNTYRKNGLIRIIPFDYGVVVKNEIRRRRIYRNALNLSAIAEPLAGAKKTVVIIAWYEPIFHFLNQHILEEVNIEGQIRALKRKGKDLFYIESASEEELRFLRERQFSIYYLDAALRGKTLAKVDISKYGWQVPDIDSYPINY